MRLRDIEHSDKTRRRGVAVFNLGDGTAATTTGWHPGDMSGRELDRIRARSALAVIGQHPLMVLFAISPALVVAGLVWWLAGAGWAILLLVVLGVTGAVLTVRKR
jgi:hypothetical protein